MNPTLRLAIILFVPIGLAGIVIVSAMGYVLFTGPRMRIQPSVRAFQAAAPAMPEGTVPVDPLEVGLYPRVPGEGEASGMINRVPASHENTERGRVYYQYYCVFCHGDAGDGNGPVGQSFTPKPADLRVPGVNAYTDGQLLHAMLTGEGHAPVLEKVVPREHRWYLVHYVRALATGNPE